MGQSPGHLPEHCVYKKKQHFSIQKISGSREVYFFAAKIYNCREKMWGLFSFFFLFWLVGFFGLEGVVVVGFACLFVLGFFVVVVVSRPPKCKMQIDLQGILCGA